MSQEPRPDWKKFVRPVEGVPSPYEEKIRQHWRQIEAQRQRINALFASKAVINPMTPGEFLTGMSEIDEAVTYLCAEINQLMTMYRNPPPPEV